MKKINFSYADATLSVHGWLEGTTVKAAFVPNVSAATVDMRQLSGLTFMGRQSD